jgi:hypothetical protein
VKSLQFQMLAWQNWVQWSFEKKWVSAAATQLVITL